MTRAWVRWLVCAGLGAATVWCAVRTVARARLDGTVRETQELARAQVERAAREAASGGGSEGPAVAALDRAGIPVGIYVVDGRGVAVATPRADVYLSDPGALLSSAAAGEGLVRAVAETGRAGERVLAVGAVTPEAISARMNGLAWRTALATLGIIGGLAALALATRAAPRRAAARAESPSPAASAAPARTAIEIARTIRPRTGVILRLRSVSDLDYFDPAADGSDSLAA